MFTYPICLFILYISKTIILINKFNEFNARTKLKWIKVIILPNTSRKCFPYSKVNQSPTSTPKSSVIKEKGKKRKKLDISGFFLVKTPQAISLSICPSLFSSLSLPSLVPAPAVAKAGCHHLVAALANFNHHRLPLPSLLQCWLKGELRR